MALVIAKKVVENVSIPVEVVPAIKTKEAELVDQLMPLWERYEAFDMKETTKQIEAVKKQLQLIANEDYEGKESAVLKGELGEVLFSPRAEPLEVESKKELFEYLVEKFGMDVALSTIKFGITELKNLLSGPELYLYAKEVPGSRTMKEVTLFSKEG